MIKKILANLFPFMAMGMFCVMGCRGASPNSRKGSADSSADFIGKTPDNNNYNNPSSADTAYKSKRDTVVPVH